MKADEEGPQELNQEGTLPERNKQQVTAKEAMPVALRTRTRVTGQQATSKRIDNSKEKSGQDTKRCKDKELIRHLTRQVKEQRDIINDMNSAIERFLRIQPVVKKIQGNIDKAKLAMNQEKFKVQIPDRDQPIEMVKSFTPDTINSLEATIQNARDDAKACQQQSDTIAAQTKRLQDALQEAHEKIQTEPWQLQHCRDIVNCNSDLESLRIKAHQSRNQSLNQSLQLLDDKAASDSGWTDAQIQKASGCKLRKAQDENKPLKQQIIDSKSECPSPKTPQTKRRHNDTTRQRRRISEKTADEIQTTMVRNMAQHPLPLSNVDDKSSSNVEAAAVPQDDPDGITEMLNYHAGIVEKLKAHPTTDNGCNPDVQTPCSKCSPIQSAMMTQMATPSSRTSMGSEDTEQPPSPQRYKKGSFVSPKESKKDMRAASDRIQKALMQVPDYAHFDLNRARNTTTLYLGNLDYNASEQDISKALDPVFQRIRVENVTIPNVNGRSVYGFIDISWAHDVLIKESDLCTIYTSGKVQVNGRPIYFRPLRDKAGSQ